MELANITSATKGSEEQKTQAALTVAQVKEQLKDAGITYSNLKGKNQNEIEAILRNAKDQSGRRLIPEITKRGGSNLKNTLYKIWK